MNLDELRRLVRENYPFPIALSHKKTLGLLDDNMEKLKNIFETAEAAVQFLALLALAQVRKDLAEGKAPDKDSLKQAIRLNQTSFGTWHKILNDVMKSYYGLKSQLIVPELFDFCFSETSDNKLSTKPIHNKALVPIRNLRNDFHHGRLPDSEIGKSISDGLKWLHLFLEEVKFLSDYQLSFTNRITLEKSADLKMPYVHDLTVFNGCYSVFDMRRWQSAIDLQKDAVIFLNPKTNNYLNLNPFIVFSDQVKDVNDVFLINNVRGKDLVYVSCQFHEEITTTNKKWKDASRYRDAVTDFLDHINLLKTTPDNVEVDDQPLPQDESPLSTAEVFRTKYHTAQSRIQHKSPYKFLDYFNPEDHDIFFGRDMERIELQHKFYNSRLVVLHGESGTGKTSLIRAGLIPFLSPDIYVPVYVRVLKEPLGEIKKELIRQLNLDEKYLELPLARFLGRETERISKTVVIVLDQFEEFFLRFPEPIRNAFKNEFAECLEIPNLDIKFLISLRAEYFSHLASFEDAVPQIFTRQVQLPHLTEAQAADAIIKPPEQFGMKIDENMVRTKLLPELTASQGIEAPLLQIVCDALYQQAEIQGKTEIGMTEYEAIGDVKGALNNYLDSKLNQFGKEQPKAKAVLKSMITTKGTKRASFSDELVSRIQSIGMDIGEDELKTSYLDKFVSYRLIRMEEVNGRQRYELAHEYMVRHIKEWIKESDREITKVLELIDRAYEAYQATGLLLESSALDLIKRFQEQLILTTEKQAFVNQSKTQANQKRRGLFLKVGMLLMLVAFGFGGAFGYQTYKKLIEARHNLGLVFNEKANQEIENKNFNAARLYALHALESFDPQTAKTERAFSMGIVIGNPHVPIVFSSSVSSDHDSEVTCLSFSPDGKTLASGSHDNNIHLWDGVSTGKEKGMLTGHSASVRSVSFSPDGKTLASGSEDKSIRLWDMKTEKENGQMIGHSASVRSVSFSPDGKTLASGSVDHTIRLWDVATGKEKAKLSGHTDSIFSVSFSPDGRTLASGSGNPYSSSSDNTIRLWDVATGKEKAKLSGHTDSIFSVSFSPDGRTLASGSHDNTIRLWDVAMGKESVIKKVIAGHSASVMSVNFSPDCKTLASGSYDKTFRLWDLATGEEKWRQLGHSGSVRSVSFSPDGRTLASGSNDKTIRLWDMATGKEKGLLSGHSNYVSSVSFSPDGKTLASGSYDKTIRLWDVATGKGNELSGHTDSIFSVSFSPDGETLASGSNDKTICLWDMSTKKEKTKLSGHSASVRSVSFSPDGKTLASGSDDKTIRLWDMSTGKEKTKLSGHSNYVSSVSFSPDGGTLASGSYDNTIRLWDVATCKEKGLLTGHSSYALSVSFSPDGRMLASGSNDKTIRLWDVATCKEKGLLTGHSDAVWSVRFSSDGMTLASGSDDKTIRLWDMVTGKEKVLLKRHEYQVTSVSFSPDGKVLASGSDDKTIRLWDLSFLYDTRSIQERIKEAEQNYNLKLDNLELQPIEPERNIYGVKPRPPKWSKNHPFYWLSKAEAGDSDAMVQLGLIYDRDNENDKALQWYQKAADFGNEYGRERLDFLKGWMEMKKSEPQIKAD